MNQMQGAVVPSGPLEWIAVAIERRLDALEAGEPEQEPEPPAPDRSGSLVELVARAIVGAQEAEWALSWKVWCNESRAAIRAVADWLDEHFESYGINTMPDYLRAELEREP